MNPREIRKRIHQNVDRLPEEKLPSSSLLCAVWRRGGAERHWHLARNHEPLEHIEPLDWGRGSG